MVNTNSGYQDNGKALLQGLKRSRKPRMERNSHGEQDKEELEAIFYWMDITSLH